MMRKVEKLLSGLQTRTLVSRDEQEVPGYADAMNMIFEGYEATRAQYSPDRAASELKHLLDDPEYASRTARIGEQIAEENGPEKVIS